jgi:hypothetical protein
MQQPKLGPRHWGRGSPKTTRCKTFEMVGEEPALAATCIGDGILSACAGLLDRYGRRSVIGGDEGGGCPRGSFAILRAATTTTVPIHQRPSLRKPSAFEPARIQKQRLRAHHFLPPFPRPQLRGSFVRVAVTDVSRNRVLS